MNEHDLLQLFARALAVSAVPLLAGTAACGRVASGPEGTRLIGWGIAPRAFTEVDAVGHALRELTLGADYSYRAVKVPLSTFDLDLLRGAAGK